MTRRGRTALPPSNPSRPFRNRSIVDPIRPSVHKSRAHAHPVRTLSLSLSLIAPAEARVHPTLINTWQGGSRSLLETQSRAPRRPSKINNTNRTQPWACGVTIVSRKLSAVVLCAGDSAV